MVGSVLSNLRKRLNVAPIWWSLIRAYSLSPCPRNVLLCRWLKILWTRFWRQCVESLSQNSRPWLILQSIRRFSTEFFSIDNQRYCCSFTCRLPHHCKSLSVWPTRRTWYPCCQPRSMFSVLNVYNISWPVTMPGRCYSPLQYVSPNVSWGVSPWLMVYFSIRGLSQLPIILSCRPLRRQEQCIQDYKLCVA